MRRSRLVNKAGQQINISENIVSFSNSPLSPELQKLITDVFTLKFTDTTNTKTFDSFHRYADPADVSAGRHCPMERSPTATILLVTPSTVLNATPSVSRRRPSPIPHINQPPTVVTFGEFGSPNAPA